MNKIRKFLNKIFPSKKSIFAAAVIGVSGGLTIYLGTLQRHFFSKRYFFYTILISLAVGVVVAWLRACLITRKYQTLNKNMRVAVIVFSAVMGLTLLANIPIQPLYYLLPDTTFEVRIPIGDIPEDQESVRLLWVETGQGYVHYTNMNFEGEWERVEKNIVFAPNQEVRITWQGKVGPMTEVAFRMTYYDQPVFVSWNGVEKEYNLNNPKEPNIFIRNEIGIPLIYMLPFILSFSVSTGFVIFTFLILLGTWQPKWKRKMSDKKHTWLFYMLPMVVVWGFSLLVFWPGIMSNDSVAQWTQNLSGDYNDWQSAFYALVLAGLMKVWYSPALIAILQVLLFAFLVAWGLKALEELGVPKVFLYIISLVFAISPLNNLYAITIWRDIPYALAVLWLTLLILRVYTSQGKWVTGKGWIWLAISAFLIAILRQNGIPVAFGLLVLLPIVYRKYWKQLIGSLLLTLLLFFFTKGPVYSFVGVDRTKSGQSNLILLHHIAAHLEKGTELESDEEAYLDSFLPISDWNYYCCYVGTISYDNDFKRDEFLASSTENRKLALDLFLRDPGVDIQHTMCAGELVWRFIDNQCYMKSTHGFSSWKPGEVSWVINNDVGLKNDSKIPSLVQSYVDNLRIFGFRDDFLVFYLRPALYLYLGMFFTAVVVLRNNDFRAFFVCLPILIQSLILLAVSYAPAIRYQYGTYITGLLLIGLAFLPRVNLDND